MLVGRYVWRFWTVVALGERLKSRSRQGAWPRADRCSGRRRWLFAGPRHTSIARAEAHGASARLDLLLRTVNSANLSFFFAQDLPGCQSFDYVHRSAAAGALRQSGLAG